MLNSVVAAQGSHTFIYRGWEVETTGNELTHTILRGAVNKHGEAIPNYHYEDLRLLFEKYSAKNLKNCLLYTSRRKPLSILLKLFSWASRKVGIPTAQALIRDI